MKRLSLQIFVIVGICLVSCSPILPTLEPLKDGWSTFDSPEFGFSFQYPSIYDKGFQSLEFTCDISVEKSNNQLYVTIGNIRINAEISNKNLEEYISYYVDNRLQKGETEQNEIEISGLSANRLQYFGRSQTIDTTILSKENKIIIIEHVEMNFFFCDLEDDGYGSYWVYEKILQSLRLN